MVTEPTQNPVLGQATHEHIIQILLDHRLETIKRLSDGEKRMAGIEGQLLINTELTKEIRDAVVTARTMSRVLRWAGGIAAACAAIWAAAITFMGGKPPSPV